MTRIRLTDEDIEINHVCDNNYGIYFKPLTCSEQDAKQLKKQILEDYKFREAIKVLLDTEDLNVVFDIKDKAEKWDKLENNGIAKYNKLLREENEELKDVIRELESQVKELKDEVIRVNERYQKYLRQNILFADELQKYKQFAESVKESVKQVMDNPKEKPVNAWFIAELRQLIEGLE